MKQKKQPKNKTEIDRLIHTLPQEGKGQITSDVSGSYTGTPIDGGVPVQDADDL